MTKKLHSKYWAGSRVDSFDGESDAARLLRLANLRRGIANFVKIASGKDIPVKFSSGEMSYTDGEKCVVISASAKPEHFDSMVGLALHESSHILYSQGLFTLYERLNLLNGLGAASKEFLDPLQSDMTRLGLSVTDFLGHIKLVLNFLEDRRIDNIMYREISGYRPYYEELYGRYFYSDVCAAMIRADEYRSQSWTSYMVHLMNMMHPDADPDALPGLADIHARINLDYIDRYTHDPRWDSFISTLPLNRKNLPLIGEDAYEIVRIIYKNLAKYTNDERNENNDNGLGEGEGDESGDSDDLSELDNLDQGMSGMTAKEIDKVLTKKDLEKVRKIQKRLVKGEMKKAEMEHDDRQTLTELETSDADLREAGAAIGKNEKCKVILYRKLTKAVLDSDSYPFSHRGYYSIAAQKPYPCSAQAVQDGLKMGQILVHKLRIMNDESTMKYTRQEHGRIDKRLLHSLGYGEQNVFSTEFVVRIKPVMVDISIDASGSMAGLKWQKALTLAAALAYVADKTRSVRVRVSIRASIHADAGMAIIYDSKSDKMDKVRNLWPYLAPTGGTPEGLTFEAMRKELLEEVKNTRRYFINLSDGEPAHSWGTSYTNYSNYSGMPAAIHTRDQVNEIRAAGVKILSYFITEYDLASIQRLNANKSSLFHTMYGADAVYIDTQSVTQVAMTLNKMFLSGE